MNLLCIVAVETEEGVEKQREFQSYPTRKDALAALYNKMWVFVSNEKTVSAIAEIVNDSGVVEKCETYVRIIPASAVEPVGEGSLG